MERHHDWQGGSGGDVAAELRPVGEPDGDATPGLGKPGIPPEVKISVWRAWAFGGAIVFIGFGTLLMGQFFEALVFVYWGAPTIAAFVVGFLSPRRKILLGSSMALLAAVLAGLFNFVFQALGNAVDFPGIYGGLFIMGVTLVIHSIPCILGAGVGDYLASLRKDRSQTNRGASKRSR